VVPSCGKRSLNLTHLVTKHAFKPSRGMVSYSIYMLHATCFAGLGAPGILR
jgi:hypothetical protein